MLAGGGPGVASKMHVSKKVGDPVRRARDERRQEGAQMRHPKCLRIMYAQTRLPKCFCEEKRSPVWGEQPQNAPQTRQVQQARARQRGA
ncbi:hypothetical protein NDU88_003135 [Pleurodeles waltl]|uniref:Uncharacterized protein n=1 Tax=Pleurodeles waltl TaxID=8319 RepID=A0AAV7TN84_PLEWA|nr:hypothetical protein NDU88_003135 [Pleurodeles waltl]